MRDPPHPSTSPEAILAAHRRLVRRAVRGLARPVDAAAVAAAIDLPAWNVERALAVLGVPFAPAARRAKGSGGSALFPPKRKEPSAGSPVSKDHFRRQNNGHAAGGGQPNKGRCFRRIAALLADGEARTTHEIAGRIGVTPGTVQWAIKENRRLFTVAGRKKVARKGTKGGQSVKTYALKSPGKNPTENVA